MINNIGKITLYVENQEEAKKFWINKLNFVVKVETEMGPNTKWIEVAPNENSITTFVLYEKGIAKVQNKNSETSHPSIILSTKDINKSYEKLRENKVEVGEIMNMPYGKMVSFKDNEGNKYLLREDK